MLSCFRILLARCGLALLFVGTAMAQPNHEAVVGTWKGDLDVQAAVLPVVFHISVANGTLKATMDSPDQGAFGIPVDEASYDGTTLTLKVAAIAGTFTGTSDGTEMTGTWEQAGQEFELDMVREAASDEDAVAEVETLWEGELPTPAGSLKLIIHLFARADGTYRATLDSPSQGAMGIPASSATLEGTKLQIEFSNIPATYEATLNAAGTEADGTWSQGGGSTELDLKKVEKTSDLGPNRPQEPKAPFPYDAEDVTYPNPAATGVTLAGTLTTPPGTGPFPAAILISGSGAQDRDESLMGHKPFLVLADHLTRHGLAVLRFDDRGYGESTGTFATATSADFATDVAAGLAYLKSRADIASDQIGLIGHSEGGLVAPMVAAEHPNDVAFIVMLAGTGITGEEILYLQARLILAAAEVDDAIIARNTARQRKIFTTIREEPDEDAAVAQITEIIAADYAHMDATERAIIGLTDTNHEAAARALVTPWMRFFLTYDPATALRQVRVPVLALNGSKDLQVPPAENLSAIEAALKAANNSDVTLQELPELNHLFQTARTGSPNEYAQIAETFAPSALTLISEWIQQRVR